MKINMKTSNMTKLGRIDPTNMKKLRTHLVVNC